MKRLVVMAMALAAWVATTGQAQEAAAAKEESPLSFSGTLDIYSAYVWRGMILDQHAVAQPGATATFDMGDAGSISANVWMNWDLSQKSGHSKTTRSGGGIDELDFTLSYSVDVGPVGLSVGHIWYTFPGGGWPKDSYSTEELYVSASYNNDIVTPFVQVYYDYNFVGQDFSADPFECLYANMGLNKSFEVTDQFSVGGALSVGWGANEYNNAYWGSEEGLSDYQAKVFCSYALTDNLTIGGTLAYTGLFDTSYGLDRDDASTPESLVWGGVNLGVSF